MQHCRVVQSQRDAEWVRKLLRTSQSLPAAFRGLVALTDHPINLRQIRKAKYTDLGSKRGQLQSFVGRFMGGHRFLKMIACSVHFSEMKQAATHRKMRTRDDNRVVLIFGHLEKPRRHLACDLQFRPNLVKYPRSPKHWKVVIAIIFPAGLAQHASSCIDAADFRCRVSLRCTK